VGLSIEVGESRGLYPISGYLKEVVDLFVSNKAGMIIDYAPPLSFLSESNLAFERDYEIHSVAVMIKLWGGQNFCAL
jgi:hypothetical protein